MTVRSPFDKLRARVLGLVGLLCLASTSGRAQDEGPTYAEKLGWPKGTRALILPVDDVGLSWDTELGTMEAIEKGVANSLSVMMPARIVLTTWRELMQRRKAIKGS